jgi:hypothetical protein
LTGLMRLEVDSRRLTLRSPLPGRVPVGIHKRAWAPASAGRVDGETGHPFAGVTLLDKAAALGPDAYRFPQKALLCYITGMHIDVEVLEAIWKTKQKKR